MSQQATQLLDAYLVQPVTSTLDTLAGFWAAHAQEHACRICEEENEVQMKLAKSRHPSARRACLRLSHFAAPARAFLCHHKIMTEVSHYLGIVQDVVLLEMRQFVFNFLHVERGLLPRMNMRYHEWIHEGYRDRFAVVLQKNRDLYTSVAVLHLIVLNREEMLGHLCSRLQAALKHDN